MNNGIVKVILVSSIAFISLWFICKMEYLFYSSIIKYISNLYATLSIISFIHWLCIRQLVNSIIYPSSSFFISGLVNSEIRSFLFTQFMSNLNQFIKNLKSKEFESLKNADGKNFSIQKHMKGN